MIKRKYRTWDEVQLEHFSKYPKELKGYLAISLAEYEKDGDEKAFLSALSIAARVRGFSAVSRSTGLNRENLYRALSKSANPRLSTVMQVLSALGFTLTIR